MNDLAISVESILTRFARGFVALSALYVGALCLYFVWRGRQ